jgi:hypothetical protein
VVNGLEQAPTAFARFFNGTNFGKLVIQLETEAQNPGGREAASL